MHENPVEFRKVAIQPVECLKAAKKLIADDYWLFVGICAVGLIVGSAAPAALLMGPMWCGIYLCHFQHLRGEKVSFETLFKGFDYFVESLIASLILAGVMMAVIMVLVVPMYVFVFAGFIGFGAAGGANNPAVAFGFLGVFAIVYLLVFVASLLVGTLFAFVYPLIVDRNLKAIPAVTISLKAVWANFGGMLGLTFLSSVLVGLASLCCYLPMFLVLPITFGANLLAYKRVFGDAPEDPGSPDAAPLGDDFAG